MQELDDLKKYIISGSEKADDYLVFPFFRKLFPKGFKKESDAEGADIYIEGKIVVELKSSEQDYIQGFYQALHYEKKGLSFTSISVITHNFIGVWKVNSIPEFAKVLVRTSNPIKPANEIGKINARKTRAAQRIEIIESSIFHYTLTNEDELFSSANDSTLHQFIQVLKNLDTERLQINPNNFIQKIQLLERFFENTIDAIHCFYSIVGYWDITSRVTTIESQGTVHVNGYKGSRTSERVNIRNRDFNDFKKFVEQHYIFTNEGSGLTVDYYFSRFDEVITKVNPDYAIQHGIFFTDNNLSKFALWYVHNYFERKLGEKYIVIDPAGGSGNLVTSWKGNLQHKIVSELQPDLLRTIERRMKLDPDQINPGFTIIPKTSENKGLNFLDKTAEQYIYELLKELNSKNLSLDKPLAFLLNPPYKNTDENKDRREKADATYGIDPTILEVTGNDAGKERYLGFLAQIMNICKIQMENSSAPTLNLNQITLPPSIKNKKESPLIFIFTPTSWLIPRPTYKKFRIEFDKYFKYESGFIFIGSEFFKIEGRFPISFTIWRYNYNPIGNNNNIRVRDLTFLSKNDLVKINWNSTLGDITSDLKEFLSKAKSINYSEKRKTIKEILNQPMYEFKRDPTLSEIKSKKSIGGLPLKDPRRINKKTYGIPLSNFIGFMDDNTPVRIKNDRFKRMSNIPDRVWFRLDNDIKSGNKTRILSGPSDKYSYAAYDMDSAKIVFNWFSLTKAINGRYPVWANQFDIWPIKTNEKYDSYFNALCFAFGLSENRCIVTKFEKDNPVNGAPEIFVDNPLCPTNSDSFWSTTLDKLVSKNHSLANNLVESIKELYNFWSINYTKGQFLYNVGLQDEAYFKYFNYSDFLTPHSGLIQIRKYAEVNSDLNLLNMFDNISSNTKAVKEKIYDLLVNEFKYFE